VGPTASDGVSEEPRAPAEDAAEPPEDVDTTGAYVRNTAVMTAGTILSRATGLVRVGAIAYALGVKTPIAAAYLTANTAPNVVYELVLGGILTSVFLPVFVRWRREQGRTEAWKVADRILTFAAIALTAVAVIGIVAAPQVVRFYGIEDPARAELATFLLRWFMPQAVFYGIGAIAGGVLNAEGRFAAPMFAPVLNNLAVIAALVAVAWIGVDDTGSVGELSDGQRLLLGAGTTFGVVAMTLALWPSLRSVGYRWRPRLDLRHPAVVRLIDLSTWVFVYVGANQIAYALIVRYTNGLDDAGGSIAAYNIGFLIFSLPHAVFAVSVITALLPSMADRWAAGDRDGVVRSFSRGLRDTSVVMIPAAFGLAALALPIARLLLERGLTRATGVVLVGDVLLAFAVGLPFFSAFQLLTRTFYAMQDSRTPALTNVVCAIVQVTASLTYAWVLELRVQGMALGHATSYAVGTAILLWRLRSSAGGLDGGRIVATLVRVVPAAAVAAGTAYLVADAVGAHEPSPSVGAQLGQVTAAVVTGMLVFAGLASIVGVREVRDIADGLRRRLRG